MAQFETVATVISDAAMELGLGEPATPVMTNTDANISQLLRHLRRVGRGLIAKHDFLQSRLQCTITTDGSTSYDLPADFVRMIDQTGWNRSQVTQMQPVTDQVWAYFQAIPSSANITVVFRTGYDGYGLPQLEVEAGLGSGQQLVFEYRSRNWLRGADSPRPDQDYPQLDSDTIHIDSHLVVCALKFAFKAAKGFPADAEFEEAKDALDAIRGVNVGAAPILRFRPCGDVRLLDERNAPRSGYGFDAGGLY